LGRAWVARLAVCGYGRGVAFEKKRGLGREATVRGGKFRVKRGEGVHGAGSDPRGLGSKGFILLIYVGEVGRRLQGRGK